MAILSFQFIKQNPWSLYLLLFFFPPPCFQSSSQFCCLNFRLYPEFDHFSPPSLPPSQPCLDIDFCSSLPISLLCSLFPYQSVIHMSARVVLLKVSQILPLLLSNPKALYLSIKPKSLQWPAGPYQICFPVACSCIPFFPPSLTLSAILPPSCSLPEVRACLRAFSFVPLPGCPSL